MIDQIAAVSENQLSMALAASGLSAVDFLLAREMLISVRQNIVENFGLKEKYSSLFRPINKKPNFMSNSDHLQILLSNGKTFQF